MKARVVEYRTKLVSGMPDEQVDRTTEMTLEAESMKQADDHGATVVQPD